MLYFVICQKAVFPISVTVVVPDLPPCSVLAFVNPKSLHLTVAKFLCTSFLCCCPKSIHSPSHIAKCTVMFCTFHDLSESRFLISVTVIGPILPLGLFEFFGVAKPGIRRCRNDCARTVLVVVAIR